jgi:acyl-coenzyme A thioesterase PaaI-like protein
MDTAQLICKAKTSAFYRKLLNFALWRVVPFNKTHRPQITALTDDEVRMMLPFIRANKNHVGGIHACALATLCEYVCGLCLLMNLNPKEYRIVMKSLQMTYHYQAKTAVKARFRLSHEWIEKEILNPLQQAESVFNEFVVDVYDENEVHICTGTINWQIKSWDKVRTSK